MWTRMGAVPLMTVAAIIPTWLEELLVTGGFVPETG
jgi:hypothetical protein